MKTYPIIFSGPMVKALLDGRKTQTRRLAWRAENKVQSFMGVEFPTEWLKRYERWQAGERPWLWVRETWNIFMLSQDAEVCWPLKSIPETDPRPDAYRNQIVLDYAVAGIDGEGPWRPSIHMPRWASRLSLEVTDMRKERLQAITSSEIKAEGIEPAFWGTGLLRDKFAELWNSIHGPGAWESNPSVIAVSFRVHKQNIDSMEARQ